MILTTTNNIEGKKTVKYLGLVSGDAVLGANIFRDFFASIRDIVGGRSAAYEKELAQGQGYRARRNARAGQKSRRQCDRRHRYRL